MFEQAAIAGRAREGVYSQTFSVGNFLVVLQLTNGESVDMELGRNTLAKIEEIISQTPDIAPKELVAIIVEEFKDGIHVEIVIAKIIAGKLSVAGTAKMVAKLVRKGQLVTLLAGKDKEQTVSVISGPVRPEDLLIIGTESFWQLVNTTDLGKVANQTIADWRDTFSPKVELLADNSSIAALFVKVDLANKIEEETESAQDNESALEPESGLTPVQNDPAYRDNSQHLGGRLRFLSNRYLSRLPNPKGIYLKRHNLGEPQNWRKSLYLVIIALLCLVSVIAFQLRSRALEQRMKTAVAMEKQAQENIDSAQKLVGVNDNIAREILAQSRSDFLAKADSFFGPNWQNGQTTEDRKLKAILANLDLKIETVAHIHKISNLDIFYDFGLLKSGVKIASAGLEKNEIFAVDPANGAAYSVGTKNKTATILIGTEELRSAKLIDGIENNVYAWSPNGIYKVDRTTTPVSSRQIATASAKWGEIRGMKTFGGNLYLLDAANNQVWKYQGTDFGFAEIIPYLKAGSLDFSKISGFAIDGFIYVLSASGNVVRFASGYPEDFKLTSLPGPFNEPTGLFVSDETQNIYILDSKGTRVIVVDKKGGYLAQYQISDLRSQISDPILLVDETVGKVFLVSGDKIYSFNLK